MFWKIRLTFRLYVTDNKTLVSSNDTNLWHQLAPKAGFAGFFQCLSERLVLLASPSNYCKVNQFPNVHFLTAFDFNVVSILDCRQFSYFYLSICDDFMVMR